MLTKSFLLTILICFALNVPCEAALVGHWKFNDGSGSSAVDSSGNGNTGTLNNAPSWVTGRLNRALSFNGSGQSVTASDIAALDFGTGPFSLSVWVKADNPTNNADGIFAKDTYAGGNSYTGIILNVSGGGRWNFETREVVGGVGPDNTVASASNASTEWTHIVGVRDGDSPATLRIYINGVESNNALEGSSTNVSNAEQVSIGLLPSSPQDFNGIIDDVRLYNTALSASQVSTLYHGGDPSLIGWWKLDEGSGVSAADSTGNANTGTLVNGPVWISGKRGANALTFNGTNQAVTASDANLPSGAAPRTMSAWVRFTHLYGSNEYATFIQYGTGTTENDSELLTGNADSSGNNYCIGSQFGDGIVGTSPINDGNWHNCTAVFDGAAWKIYTDGRFEGSKVVTTNTILAGTIRIGRGTGAFVSDFFEGSIDDVRIYDRVLSDQEIKNLIGSVTIRGATRVNGFKMK